ncbi:MAG TPA: M14 metallopeptidase family protein, partial [Vicinamibacteria bacterium]|nr:M14 metallopeptidase family protein [Vicinamibacteria bacterium]
MILALALALVAADVPRPELMPGARYDARIPPLKEVVGHDFGDEISSPDQITAYLKALAAASPERTKLVEYARTWEGRPLHVLAIGSPARMARLAEVRQGLARLADPRGLAAGEADRLVGELPVVTWLMHAVHGNEISSSDAALAEAYHFLAAQGDADVDTVLRESIVLVDPLQNPDGRARFLAQNMLGRAAEPDPEPLSAEHDEPWPGGRGNHYLFDMNRDWFARSQPETRGRTDLYLEWHPQVVVDLHEMGGDSTYYFAPPAEPENPYITADQRRWFEAFGRANAERFDARGFAYFVREVYDSFYPGYGESWPIFQGAVGMTYEQASPRGLLYR